jgi:hypothetical protein
VTLCVGRAECVRVASGCQVAGSRRWRRLRRHWLRAAVCISDGSATSTGVADGGSKSSNRRSKRSRAVCDPPIAAVLRDYRMLGHDDGEGRPRRYMSLYGGIVTKML